MKVVDTCACDYAPNAQSNKRWCCGDYPHLDTSQWALEKITTETTRWGWGAGWICFYYLGSMTKRAAYSVFTQTF